MKRTRIAAAVACVLMALAIGIAWSTWANATPLDVGPWRDRADPASTLAAADERRAQTGAHPDPVVAAREAVHSDLVGLRVPVLVLMDDSMAPAPGATLYFLPPRTEAQHAIDEERLDAGDDEPYLRAAGSMVVCDANGRAEIAADANTPAIARLGEFYGEAFLPGDATADVPILLSLSRDVTLRVEVVDDGGRPCPGLFVEAMSKSACRRRGSGTFDQQFGPTDAQGLALSPHLQRVMSLPGPDVLAFSMHVCCMTSQLDAVRREVRADELFAGTPIRLVVPSGGEVHVRVVDADGKPYNQGAPILRSVADEITCTPSWSGEQVWRYSQVPVARRWLANLHTGENSPSVAFDGPRQAGELVQVELRVPRRTWLLRGRLLQDGKPFGHANVRLAGDPDGDAISGRRSRTTDEGGRFSFAGTMRDDLDACAVSLLVEHACLPSDTRIACNQQLTPGEVDLGDVVLPPFAVERALATVRVLVDGKDVSATAGASLSVRDDKERHPGNPWPTQTRKTTRGVELWGRVPAGELTVFVVANGYLGRHVVVTLHDAVTVELERAAELWASLVPPVVPPDALNLYLAAEGVEADHGRSPTEWRTNQWNWPFQAPGRYRICVEVGDTVVYESEMFELQAGMNRWPGDGNVRDLRHIARVAHIGVFDAETGARIDDPLLHKVSRRQSDEGEGEVEDALDASAWCLVAANAPDLLVAAEGYQPVRVPGPTNDQRIGLHRMTKVRVFASPRASRTIVRVVEDSVRDRLLRELVSPSHESEVNYDREDSLDLLFARGTILEFVAVVDGVQLPAQRVLVGAQSPQEVQLR